jgi:hypothetical protein
MNGFKVQNGFKIGSMDPIRFIGSRAYMEARTVNLTPKWNYGPRTREQTLLALPDFGEPQNCACPDLGHTIAAARVAGYFVRRMVCLKNYSGYTLHCERMPAENNATILPPKRNHE